MKGSERRLSPQWGDNLYPPMVVWVRAPHFKAGLAFDRQTGVVTEAAPILKWAIGKSWGYVSGYFGSKGYDYVMWIDGHHPSQGGRYFEESVAERGAHPRDEREKRPSAASDEDGALLSNGGALPDEPSEPVPAPERRH